MDQEHHFSVGLDWTGNLGNGTATTRGFDRAHRVTAPGKPELLGSAAPAFHGDQARWNPEELLIAALAQCHMMSYFYLAVKHGVVVVDYADNATGIVRMEGEGGHFSRVDLRPRMTISSGDLDLAYRLHDDAEQLCFIAQSVNFPVLHDPVIAFADPVG